LHGSVGYIDARLTDFDGTGQFDGNHLPNSPGYTVNIGTRFTQPLSAATNAVARIDFNRAGREYFSEDNVINQPAYNTVDAQLGFEFERWSASLFGRNILSTRYVTSAFSRNISPLLFVPLNIDPYYTAVGAQYGVELKYRF
jgi:iron complex outermembrane receptor protein